MTKPRSLSPKEKLRLLQESDHWRKWQSLDDERQCVLCERTFSGNDVRITHERHGKPVVHCPTPDCSSSPREWLHPGNPLTDDMAWQDWLRILDDLSPEDAHNETAPIPGRRSRSFIE
jgi:hypothetical protein